MDHICVCENGNSKAWYKAPGHFNGTLVKNTFACNQSLFTCHVCYSWWQSLVCVRLWQKTSVLSAGCICKDNTQRGNKGIMEWFTPNPVSNKSYMHSFLTLFVRCNHIAGPHNKSCLLAYWCCGIICQETLCAVSSVMAVPATVIYFTCYDQLCAALRVRMGTCADEAPLVAGAIARGEPQVAHDLILSTFSQCLLNRTSSFSKKIYFAGIIYQFQVMSLSHLQQCLNNVGSLITWIISKGSHPYFLPYSLYIYNLIWW